MSKAVLISINPKWCKKIANLRKTVEIRKTAPKIEVPFKCYIYCTKAPKKLITIFRDGEKSYDGEIYHGKTKFITWDGIGVPDDIDSAMQMVIGEFVCNKIDRMTHIGTMSGGKSYELYVESPDLEYEYADELLQAACMTKAEAEKYLKGSDGYGWHISDLKIYDRPRSLDEFSRFGFWGMNGTGVCGNYGCENYGPSDSYMIPPTCKINGCSVCRPPQSWCYVEDFCE